MAYYIYSDRYNSNCIGMYDDEGYIYNACQFFNGLTPDSSHLVVRTEPIGACKPKGNSVICFPFLIAH